MKKYFSVIKIKFLTNLQYKAATFCGIINQFIWGMMKIFLYYSLYSSEHINRAIPINFTELASYIWLEQLLLPLFASWMIEEDILESINTGNIAYDLLRPMDLYTTWFSKSISGRLSKTSIRCIPVLFFIFFLPEQYRLSFPSSPINFIFFIISLALSLLLMTTVNMWIYILTAVTYSSVGIKMLFVSVISFCSGNIIPLPFFSEKILFFLKLTPFFYMQNIPLRIYSGNIEGNTILQSILMQIVWIIIMIFIGKYFTHKISKKIIIQGG